MSDFDRKVPERLRRRALATLPAASPALPASSGAFLGSRTDILAKDRLFVDEHARFLKARSAQSVAMRDLIQARIELATVLSRLARLDQFIAHDERMFVIRSETEAAIAEAELADARARIRKPSSATASDGLVEMVDGIASQLPDIPEEARTTLRELLLGALQEKKS